MESLPVQTVIKYTRTKWLWLIISLLILIGSVYLLFSVTNIVQIIMALSGCLTGLLMTIMNFREISELNKPQLIINGQGIEHRNGSRFRWEEIDGERIVYLGRHHAVPYLSLQTSSGNRLFKIAEWNLPPEAILALLKQYRDA